MIANFHPALQHFIGGGLIGLCLLCTAFFLVLFWEFYVARERSAAIRWLGCVMFWTATSCALILGIAYAYMIGPDTTILDDLGIALLVPTKAMLLFTIAMVRIHVNREG